MENVYLERLKNEYAQENDYDTWFTFQFHSGRYRQDIALNAIAEKYANSKLKESLEVDNLKISGKLIYTKLPEEIKYILSVSEGWLVGGAIDDICEGATPKDFDIVVPDTTKYHMTISSIHKAYIKDYKNMTINTFGGMKLNINNYEVDIWSDTLEGYLKKAERVKYMYKLNGNKLLTLI